MKHIEVGQFAKEKDLIEDYDEDYDSYVIDEDKVRREPSAITVGFSTFRPPEQHLIVLLNTSCTSFVNLPGHFLLGTMIW